MASPPLPAVPSSSPTPSSTAALSPSHIPPSSSPASQYVFPKAKPSLEADKSEFVLFRNQMEAQMNGFMESVLSLVRSHRSPGVSVGDDVSVGVGDNNVVVRDRVSGESARFSESFEQRQLSRSPSEARRQSGVGEKVRNYCPRAGSSSKAQESLSPGGGSSKLDSPSKRRKASGRRESDPSTRRSSRHHRHRRMVSPETSSRRSQSKRHYLRLSSSGESSSSSSSVSSYSSSSDPPLLVIASGIRPLGP